MPSADLVSPRVPWRAALLGLATAGLGQLYSGRPLRAIILHALSGAVVITCIRAAFIPFKAWNVVTPVVGLLLCWILVLGDAVRCPRRAPPTYRLKAYNRWYVYLLLLVLAVVEQDALKAFMHDRFEQGFKVTAGSMLPTLSIGDHIFVDKRAYVEGMPQRGDIIALRYPPKPSVIFVKRVIAVGGDVLRIEHKKVYLNGQPLFEPYGQFQIPTLLPLRDNFPPTPSLLETLPAAWGLDPAWKREMPNFIHDDGLHVPPDNLFVLGDNRDNSLDSRFSGFVPQADVLGKASMIYFSWDAKARRVRWDRIGEVLK